MDTVRGIVSPPVLLHGYKNGGRGSEVAGGIGLPVSDDRAVDVNNLKYVFIFYAQWKTFLKELYESS